MNKALLIVVTSVATLLLTTGCSTSTGVSSSPDLQSGDRTICKTAIHTQEHSSDKVMQIIKSAGEKEGWRMTPFKSNAIIAEKFVDGEMISTTITFAKEHISCTKCKESEDELKILRAAIVDELKKEDAHH
ncbi:hypothetical protein CVO_00315 [Sulfurimonas sp. CVO]|jgi:hypothetical protein|uniref:Lipoprotein n=1 Tax=Sulfurimonas xiamenensis TaxID=2590021 RepID=A0AAJ4A531_9BACT|nr:MULTISPECIES: hypothetical protein [Sulfurimonas]QFR44073.1 hypothetical protein FJR47_09140 [Sulfurimonas xiamenensis]QHG90368.1 hypothetical protein CVO_00315 [Sulfurimonas sp. CVO]